MVSKRQRLARRQHKEEHPELYPKAEEPARKLKGGRVGKRKGSRGSRLKPGDSCFICKGKDHIAKLCPKKAEWEKNKICLFCRRRGHSLKNCPSKEEGTDKKYCYNCGESGHSLSTCPQPLQDGGTKFATCFICNESGHLSKNCPKSTHGIYPKGGSCKNCGSVRHLAKDCPDKSKKKSDVGVDKSFEFSNYSWQGKKASFTSGDDLEDDFTEDKKINCKEEAMNSKETGKSTYPSNKKRGPKERTLKPTFNNQRVAMVG